MHLNVQSRFSNTLQRPVAAAVVYKGTKTPVAVCSMPAYLNDYRVPTLRQAQAVLQGR